MRNYEHFRGNGGEILLPDPKSSKGKWGLHQPEYLEPDDPHFLRKGHTTFPHSEVVYQLTEESEAIGLYQGKPFGDGTIIVEEQDYSGGFVEGGIHKSKVVWDE